MMRKLIIDCDPGRDDAINLFLAPPTTEIYEILGKRLLPKMLDLKRSRAMRSFYVS